MTFDRKQEGGMHSKTWKASLENREWLRSIFMFRQTWWKQITLRYTRTWYQVHVRTVAKIPTCCLLYLVRSTAEIHILLSQQLVCHFPILKARIDSYKYKNLVSGARVPVKSLNKKDSTTSSTPRSRR